jgi:hypothetical protein
LWMLKGIWQCPRMETVIGGSATNQILKCGLCLYRRVVMVHIIVYDFDAVSCRTQPEIEIHLVPSVEQALKT